MKEIMLFGAGAFCGVLFSWIMGALLVVQAPKPARRKCSSCSYTAGPNTVLIPANRCPSCGAWMQRQD